MKYSLSEEDAEARVKRCVALLDADESIPNWADHISTLWLVMYDLKWCPFGFLFGHFDVGCAHYGIQTSAEAEQYGIFVHNAKDDRDELEQYAILAKFWRIEIEKRQTGLAFST